MFGLRGFQDNLQTEKKMVRSDLGTHSRKKYTEKMMASSKMNKLNYGGNGRPEQLSEDQILLGKKTLSTELLKVNMDLIAYNQLII